MWECMLRLSILFSHFKKKLFDLSHIMIRLVYIKHHSVSLFNSLKILAIHEIFKIETLKFVFDYLSKNNPSQFNNDFIYPICNINNTDTEKLNCLYPW